MNPSERWTDERLDDRFAGIDAQLRRQEGAIQLMADTGMRVVAIDGRLQSAVEELRDCREGITALGKRLDETAETLREGELAQLKAKEIEREELRLERKSDRRWLIGTVLTSALLIVAALAALSGYLT
jgi:soluble cytochrome b562